METHTNKLSGLKALLYEKKQAEVWRTLIDQIVKGNVIPVIGPEMARINGCPSTTFLLNALANEYFDIKEPVSSFTSLLSNPKLSPEDSIYILVDAFVEAHPEFFESSELLESFLSCNFFPFIITTTIDPLVENVMRKKYGDKLRVLSFYNNPDINEDIRNSSDTTCPTIYYMFGKVNSVEKSFVLTDSDLLRFSRSWLMPKDSGNKAKPNYLSNALANKYLLVLGNNFQDWLFRFFWFAMKDERLGIKANIPNGLENLEHTDEQLIEFLNYSNIRMQESKLPDFVEKLRTQLQNINVEIPEFSKPKINADVFISYSRADKEVAYKLFIALKETGINVWYDRDSLGVGVDFRNDIRDSIRTCKLFVPILSHNITHQFKEEHIYRLEWAWAVEHKRMISSAVDYIVPFAEVGFNIENRVADVPEEIHRHNAFIFNAAESLDKDINNFVAKLKDLLEK